MYKKFLYAAIAGLLISIPLCACGRQEETTETLVTESLNPIEEIIIKEPFTEDQINEWGRERTVEPIELLVPSKYAKKMTLLQGTIDHVATYKQRLNIFGNGQWYNLKDTTFRTDSFLKFKVTFPDDCSNIQIIEQRDISAPIPYVYCSFVSNNQIYIYTAGGTLLFAAPFNNNTDKLISFFWIDKTSDTSIEAMGIYEVEILHNNNGEFSVTSFELKERDGAIHHDSNIGFEYTSVTRVLEPVVKNKDEIIGKVVDVYYKNDITNGILLREFYAVLENGEVYTVIADDKHFSVPSIGIFEACPEKEKILWSDFDSQIYTVKGDDRHVYGEGYSCDTDAILYYELPEGYSTKNIQMIISGDPTFSVLVVFDDNKAFFAPKATRVPSNKNNEFTHIRAQLDEWPELSQFLQTNSVKDIVVDNDTLYIVTSDGYLYMASYFHWDLTYETQTLDTVYPT